jgi:hypothetical protein
MFHTNESYDVVSCLLVEIMHGNVRLLPLSRETARPKCPVQVPQCKLIV